MRKILTTTVSAAALALATSLSARADGLERIKYNHPGLVVDLGVGLWAYPLPLDCNGDGVTDLAVSCPDKPYNGLYIFENPGGDLARNSLPVFKASRQLGKGEAYPSVSYVGGRPRVLTAGKEHPDFLTSGFENPTKLPLPVNPHPRKVRGNFWRYVDFDQDGQADIVVGSDDWTDYGWDNAYDAAGNWTNGPLRGSVYVLRITGTDAAPRWEKPVQLLAGEQPLETYGWPAPCFADFRGAKKLDLICGEFRDSFTFFENIGTATAPKYAPGRVVRTPDGTPLKMDLEMITPTTFDWNKDGRPDLICGDEDGRVAFLENTGRVDDAGTPIFAAPRYFQQQADDVKCGALATPVGVDWDGDGAIDLVSGNSAGYLEFFKNLSAPGVEAPKWAAPQKLAADGKVIRFQAGPNGSIQGPAEAKWGYTTLSVADWDGDGLPDLVVNSILGKVVWFKNVGTRTAPKLATAQPIDVEWNGAQPALAWGWMKPEGKALLTQWRTTPVVVDWNRDGLPDLVMLDHEGYLALFARAEQGGKRVLLPPQRVFRGSDGNPLRLTTGTGGKSGRRKLTIVDWDGDGALDILLNGQNAELWRQTAHADGTWTFTNTGALDTRVLAGHDTSPTTVDWNQDGVPDLLLGAEDGRFYYLRNPRAKQ